MQISICTSNFFFLPVPLTINSEYGLFYKQNVLTELLISYNAEIIVIKKKAPEERTVCRNVDVQS